MNPFCLLFFIVVNSVYSIDIEMTVETPKGNRVQTEPVGQVSSNSFEEVAKYIENNRNLCDRLITETNDILMNFNGLNEEINEEKIQDLESLINLYETHSKECSKVLLTAYNIGNEIIVTEDDKNLKKGILLDLLSSNWFVESNSVTFLKDLQEIKQSVTDSIKIKQIISKFNQVIHVKNHVNKINQLISKTKPLGFDKYLEDKPVVALKLELPKKLRTKFRPSSASSQTN